jgi:hypothetical protein
LFQVFFKVHKAILRQTIINEVRKDFKISVEMKQVWKVRAFNHNCPFHQPQSSMRMMLVSSARCSGIEENWRDGERWGWVLAGIHAWRLFRLEDKLVYTVESTLYINPVLTN